MTPPQAPITANIAAAGVNSSQLGLMSVAAPAANPPASASANTATGQRNVAK